ncbi:hypothetical protein G3A39_38400 [Paraburkholderia aspalathi]|nr:hypothetical protein [Paraburkholderia aspalathi]
MNLLNFKLIGSVIVVAALTLSWVHYTALKADLENTRTELAVANLAVETAIHAAKVTAETLEKVQAEHQKTVGILEDVQFSLATMQSKNRQLEAEIISVAPEKDGPVAPVLEDLRQVRFGGAQ